MQVDDGDRTLREYVRIVIRRKWIVVASVLAATAGATTLSLVSTPIYSAEAQVLVEPRSGEAVFQQDQALNVQNLERSIQTEIRVMEGQRVRLRVQSDLGLTGLPPEVSAASLGSTDVVSVTVRSADAESARLLADAYVAAYTETRREQAVASMLAAIEEIQARIDELDEQLAAVDGRIADAPFSDANDAASVGNAERLALLDQQTAYKTRLGELQIDASLTTGGASVVKAAETPADPVSPQPLRSAGLAALFGLVFGACAAAVVDRMDDSLRTHDDIATITDLPVLAVVPVEAPPDQRPIAMSEPHEFAVEVYRGLRANLQFLGLDEPLRTVLVTSSLSGEGKTTTATNLAVVLAQAGRRVLLLDADLRRPRVHTIFGVSQAPGLSEVVLGEPVEMVTHHIDAGPSIITAGTAPPNPSEMLASARFHALIAELRSSYEFVIVDSAPVLPVADSIALSRAVEGVLLVAQAGGVNRRNVRESLARLERVGAQVIGMILNQASDGSQRGGSYGYGYGYGYADSYGPPGPQSASVEPDREETGTPV